ncbi:MAG: gfo/Idh/MocA family oxidoreductase, partial [Spirochaetaceae bacterium]
PIAVTSGDAEEIAKLARAHSVVFMSSSALRFASPFVDALADSTFGRVIGIDCAGPMQIEPTQNGLFWYGIHTVEMVYAALGVGCARLSAVRTDEHDVVCGEWSDGRLATIRGNRAGNTTFTAVIHRENGTQLVNASTGRKPYYVGLLEAIMTMIRTAEAPIDPSETLEIVRFIEAANTARVSGHGVAEINNQAPKEHT